jgi:hypothetical protein
MIIRVGHYYPVRGRRRNQVITWYYKPPNVIGDWHWVAATTAAAGQERILGTSRY